MKLDSRANQWNQTEVLPATTTLKQKAASSEQMNVPQNKSAKRSNQKPQKVTLIPLYPDTLIPSYTLYPYTFIPLMPLYPFTNHQIHLLAHDWSKRVT